MVTSRKVSLVLVLLEVDPILGNGNRIFKNIIVLHRFKEVKCLSRVTLGLCC